MKVKVAAAQMEIKPWDLKYNYEKIEKIFGYVHKHKCNFLCLPEECWVGLRYKEKRENEVADFVKEKVSHLSKKHHVYCIAGTFVEKEEVENHLHNYSYLFSPKGEIIGRYPKRHPVPKSEVGITPGHVHRVFDTEFGKVGLQICRDILYSEVTKITADLGAKIIFSPAFWSKFSTEYGSSIKEFHANDELQTIKYLVPARALENEVIFVFCNAAGEYQTPERQDTLLGYSQVCYPLSGPVKIARNNREQIIIRSVDTEVVDIARESWKIRDH